jgi:putative ATP-binding cassette transporter
MWRGGALIMSSDSDTGSPETAGEPGGAALGFSLLGLLERLRFAPSDFPSRLLWRPPASSSIGRLLAIAVLSAVCGTAILLILNAEARLTESRDYSVLMALAFIAVLVVYRLSQRVLMDRACRSIEQALESTRTRIAGKLMGLSLREVEAMTRGRLIDGMARHYEVLSQTVMPLVWGVESLILAVFMLVYLFYLSAMAGFLTVLVAGLLVLGYLTTSGRLQATMEAADRADAGLARLSEDIVHGFKELRLNTGKSAAVRDDFAARSRETRDHRIEAGSTVGELFVSVNSTSYLLAAGMVFLLPLLSGNGESGISRIVTAVIFLLGPIGGVANAIQQLATARFVLGGIREFEREIEARGQQEAAPPHAIGGFAAIEATGLHYTHKASPHDGPGFAVRGLDLRLEPGRVVFITGANGSGKTTALRLLSGLYPPDGGHLALDGRVLPAQAPQAYRELFATVFADFHLFASPYGLDPDGLARLEAALQELGIRDKLPGDLAQGFDPSALSTGQRKRLALALALAEDRPVLLLDEWAADQDPATREEFYRTMLARIKAEGKAVIAVSHDERYFDCADARYHMEDGRMERVV